MPEPDTSRSVLLSAWSDRLGRVALRSGQLLLVLILATAVVYALVQLKLVVIPILIAVILAAALSPVVRFLRRRGVPNLLATWLTLLGGLLIIGGVLTGIVFAVRSQWSELVDSASSGIQELQRFLADTDLPVDQQQIEDARTAVIDFLTSSQFGSSALAGVLAVTEVLTGAFLLLVLLFFFLKDGALIWEFFLRPFRGAKLERGRRIGRTAVRVLGGYIRGTAIVALVDALGIGIALVVLQVPLAIPLAAIVFLGAFIPLVGATVAGILAALVALVANGPIVALIVIGVVIVVNQLEGDFLQPVVMGQSLRLHPLVILLALTAGTILGGIVGAVLSVPIAAVAWAVIKAWDVPEPRPAEPAPRALPDTP
ncbi:MAG: family transporter [Naasia sp.]|nr:family transporter [Naasia sp.]